MAGGAPGRYQAIIEVRRISIVAGEVIARAHMLVGGLVGSGRVDDDVLDAAG